MRLRIAIVALLVLVAVGAGSVQAATHGRHSHGTSVVYMANARLEASAVARPRSYVVSGGPRISKIKWKGYGGAVASGMARVGAYRAALRASRVKTVSGRRFYTRLILGYVGKHPKGKRRQSLDIAPLPIGADAMRQLAQSLEKAGTPAKREAALLAALQALGIGVYNGNGAQVQAGFEQGPDGIYLYDFEVQALAAQLGRGELGSFDGLAAALNLAGFTLGRQPLTGESLAKATAVGIAKLHGKAATPEAALGLLVRDLGLARGVDLASPQPSSKAILDQLQMLLLTIDLARAQGGGPATMSDGPALRPPVAQASESCSESGSDFFGAASTGSLGASILLGKGIGPRAILTKEILGGIHGVALAFSFHFKALQSLVGGAFGSNGPKSATPMRFQVQAELLDNASHVQANCGALQNQKPSVAGIPVEWDFAAVGHIEYLGTMQCQAGCTATNSDGIATATFQPDDEYLPGSGPTFIEHGTVNATASPQHAKGNVLGSIAEALGFTKEAPIGWEVSWHDPGGYRIEVPTIETQGDFSQIHYEMKDHVENEETCLQRPDTPLSFAHPLVPRPFGAGADWFTLGTASAEAGLGFGDPRESKWFEEANEIIAGEATGWYENASGLPALLPVGLNAPAFDKDGIADGIGEENEGFGPLQVAGQLVFTSPTAEIQLTANRTGASPGQQIFDLPLEKARICPQL